MNRRQFLKSAVITTIGTLALSSCKKSLTEKNNNSQRSSKMKVLLVNGSPHKEGCTYTALKIVADTLNKENIETEIFWIGSKPLSGCIGCGACFKMHKCVFNDVVNEFTEKAKDCDGFVFGSPVHYASATGAMTSFMDRAFMSDEAGNRSLLRKPAAVVTSSRRAGATATLDQLQKWLSYSEMPIVSSRYWNEVHGYTPEDVLKDKEGVQIMEVLGRNMAWLLKCIQAGKNNGILQPKTETKIFTNFIR